jgi:hypothetical protein
MSTAFFSVSKLSSASANILELQHQHFLKASNMSFFSITKPSSVSAKLRQGEEYAFSLSNYVIAPA